MPNYTQRAVNTFVKGLITESGELTFPENASTDELNCELFRDGSRRRRKSLKVEESGSNSTFTIPSGALVNFGEWKNVGNDADKTYLVTQVNGVLYFYGKNAAPYSGEEVTGSINLASYQVSGESASSYKCQFVSVLGFLVVVSPAINPIHIEESAGTFTVTEFPCYVRDFKWLGDRSEYTDEIASGSVSPERQYDTLNSGWPSITFVPTVTTWTNASSTDDQLGTFIAGETAYPPLTHPWFSGKNSSGIFSTVEWKKVFSGSSIIGNGHFIYDLWEKDRTGVSGVSGLDTITEPTRFSCTEVFFERVFFSGLDSKDNSGKVFFSKILQEIDEIGHFFQKNDPTAEDISDLLDDDGGVINIPDAVDIKKLYAFRNSIFVFAENGVWQITGVDNAFKSTAYSITKVTDVGILTAKSFTAAEGVPFWWGRHGIHSLAFDEYGNASERNVSISTIQTLWNNIDTTAKEAVQAEYDKVNKKIIWLYPSDDSGETTKKNELLILDVTLQAFYPWSVADETGSTDYIVGMQFYSGLGTQNVSFDVLTTAGDDVVTSAGDDVISTQPTPLSGTSISVAFMVRNSSDQTMTMAFFNGTDFLDWGSADYTSYAETGYDFIGDLLLKKTAPYITTYLRETETGWVGTEETGYDPVGESSLLISTYWDFKKNPSSTPQQAYRRQQLSLIDPTEFTSLESVVTSRLKCRGRGRSLRIRLESETGKDFIYLGHSLLVDVAGRF